MKEKFRYYFVKYKEEISSNGARLFVVTLMYTICVVLAKKVVVPYTLFIWDLW